MRRYLTLWSELLATTWREQPKLTAGLFGAEFGGLIATVGVAAATGAAVAGASDRSPGAALAAAGALALISSVNVMVRGLRPSLIFRAVSQVSDVRVDPQIVTDIATTEGTEHLERGDVQARMTLLRTASWNVVASLWSAVSIVFVLLRLVTVLLLLSWVSPWLLALMPLACVPLWCDRRGRRLVADAETANAEAFALQRHLFDLATSASAGKELRVTGAAAELGRRQRAAWDKNTAGLHRAQLGASWWRMTGWSVFVIGFMGCLAAAIRPQAGAVVAAQVVLAVTAAATLQQSVGAAVNQVAGALGASRVIEPYLWLRRYVAGQRPAARGRQPVPGTLLHGISLCHVGFTYPGAAQPAVRDVSVHLPAGSVVAVVGEYGSGKTTLVKLLNKFYRPGEGQILVDGADLTMLDTEGWRARTSVAFQDFGRYPQTTLAESVGAGDLSHLDDADRVGDAIRAADAEAFVRRLPEGLHTRLSPAYGGVDLSEGQWQRTALARASMRTDPLLFVLDEPTASIDAPSEHEIVQRYVARARLLARRTGAVTVVVTHRFSTIDNADLILVMDKGELIEHGTHGQLVAQGGLYSRLYGLQATAYHLTPSTPENADGGPADPW
ncbi:ATP-binding cassette domain-containing protein [Micromonospora sp. NPDC049240]|uniref:ATP-binding cassette domain-containing protein n=1 Tax=Micromonospora sp. NPDC049240 TaxID=3155151 RepID=UPI0033E6CF04